MSMNQYSQQQAGAASLAKAEIIRHYEYDSSGARMYFSSAPEIIGRIVFLVGLLGSAFLILFLAGILGALAAEAIPFSPIINPVGKPLYEAFSLLGTIFGLLLLFGLLIITLIIKRIRSLIIYGYVFAFLGLLINGSVTGLIVFIEGVKFNNFWWLLSLIVAIVSLCMWCIGSLFLLIAAYRRRRELERSYLSFIQKSANT